MRIKYREDIRPQVALAALAVQEAGCSLSDILGHRVWFTFDEKKGNICVQCFPDEWVITWSYCKDAPELKTYEELLSQLKKELAEFKNKSSGDQND